MPKLQKKGLFRRLLIVATIAGVWLDILHRSRIVLSADHCTGYLNEPYYQDYRCVNGISHNIDAYWVLPVILAIVGTAICIGLLIGAVAVCRYIVSGPKPAPSYRCQLGDNCPCVDHQDRLERQRDDANMTNIAVAAAAGAVIGSSLSN